MKKHMTILLIAISALLISNCNSQSNKEPSEKEELREAYMVVQKYLRFVFDGVSISGSGPFVDSLRTLYFPRETSETGGGDEDIWVVDSFQIKSLVCDTTGQCIAQVDFINAIRIGNDFTIRERIPLTKDTVVVRQRKIVPTGNVHIGRAAFLSHLRCLEERKEEKNYQGLLKELMPPQK